MAEEGDDNDDEDDGSGRSTTSVGGGGKGWSRYTLFFSILGYGGRESSESLEPSSGLAFRPMTGEHNLLLLLLLPTLGITFSLSS